MATTTSTSAPSPRQARGRGWGRPKAGGLHWGWQLLRAGERGGGRGWRTPEPRSSSSLFSSSQKSLPSQSRHLTTSLISRPMMISQLLKFGFLSYWYSDFYVDQLWAAQFWTTVHNDLCQSSTKVRSSDCAMNRQAGLRRKACFAFELFSFWSSNPLQIILILSLTVRFLPKLLRCGSPYKGKPNWLVKRHWLWFDLKPQCLCRFQMFPGYEGFYATRLHSLNRPLSVDKKLTSLGWFQRGLFHK